MEFQARALIRSIERSRTWGMTPKKNCWILQYHFNLKSFNMLYWVLLLALCIHYLPGVALKSGVVSGRESWKGSSPLVSFPAFGICVGHASVWDDTWLSNQPWNHCFECVDLFGLWFSCVVTILLWYCLPFLLKPLNPPFRSIPSRWAYQFMKVRMKKHNQINRLVVMMMYQFSP